MKLAWILAALVVAQAVSASQVPVMVLKGGGQWVMRSCEEGAGCANMTAGMKAPVRPNRAGALALMGAVMLITCGVAVYALKKHIDTRDD